MDAVSAESVPKISSEAAASESAAYCFGSGTRFTESKNCVEALGDFSVLGDEHLLSILCFLSERDLNAFGIASKTCLRISSDVRLWGAILCAHFPKMWGALSEEQRMDAVSSFCKDRAHSDPYEHVGTITHPCHGLMKFGCDNFSVDGDTFVSVGPDDERYLQVWNHRTGEKGSILRGHLDTITCCISHKGTVASGSYDGTIRLWDADSGRQLRSYRCGEFSFGYKGDFPGRLHLTGDRIVCSTCDRSTLKILDRSSGRCLMEDGHSWRYLGVVGDVLVTSKHYDYSTFELATYSLESGNLLCAGPAIARQLYEEKTYTILDDTLLYAPGGWGKIYGLTIGSGEKSVDLAAEQCGTVECLDAQNDIVVGGFRDGNIGVWCHSNAALLRLSSSEETEVTHVHIADGLIYTRGMRGTKDLKIWNLLTGGLSQCLMSTKPIGACLFSGTKLILRSPTEYRELREGGIEALDIDDVYVWERASKEHPKYNVNDLPEEEVLDEEPASSSESNDAPLPSVATGETFPDGGVGLAAVVAGLALAAFAAMRFANQ